MTSSVAKVGQCQMYDEIEMIGGCKRHSLHKVQIEALPQIPPTVRPSSWQSALDEYRHFPKVETGSGQTISWPIANWKCPLFQL